MNRGVARRTTFFSDADRVEFGRLLGVASERSGVEIHAYCLMPNHFHLVVHCPAGGLSDFVQLLVGVYTRRANERSGRDGPLFRGRFRSRSIGDDSYLRTAVRYVHRNPLALPTVDRVDAYRWSSHRPYVGLRRRPTWLHTSFVLAMFDDDTGRFGGFVESADAVPQCTVDQDRLDEAVWLTVEEVAGDLDRAAQGLVRTVFNLASDMLEPGRTSPALRRARRLARSEPALIDAALRAITLAA